MNINELENELLKPMTQEADEQAALYFKALVTLAEANPERTAADFLMDIQTQSDISDMFFDFLTMGYVHGIKATQEAVARVFNK